MLKHGNSESKQEYYYNKLNEYYKLKSKYESDVKREKNIIKKGENFSLRELNKYKPKCINCKRPGGTNFIQKMEDENRIVTATCNVLINPCNLDIKINLGSHFSINEFLDDLQNDTRDLKREIIENKNKQLFSFISDEQTVSIFEKLKTELNEDMVMLEEYTNIYNEITNNKQKNEDYIKESENLQVYILQMKNLIKQFNHTNDKNLVNDVVNIYVDKVLKTNKILLDLKYQTNEIDYDELDNTYNLVQKKFDIKSFELELIEPKVESFVVGGKIEYNRKDDKQKDSEKRVPDKLDDLVDGFSIKNNNIIWTNTSYEKMYKYFSKKLQDALKSNPEWMKLFLDDCYLKRINNEPCDFVSIPNLQIPPKKTNENGITKFDFNNKLYNDYFNKLDESYKTTLLTLYKETNGIKDYSLLKNQLKNLIANELDYTKVNRYPPIK